jgi:hypothetical protein
MPFLRFNVSLTIVVSLLAGCAPSGPLRRADQTTLNNTTADKCQSSYADIDREIYKIATDFKKSNSDRNEFLKREEKKIPANEPCWITAFEQHKNFDLLYAEFDDEGNATDVAKSAAFKDSELQLIETEIPKLLAAHGSLNIVLFTHGWHGNARADNDYSIEFKGLLMDIAKREESLAREREPSATSGVSNNPQKPFRTVGIEVAWRGDSFDKYLNVWDRKLAADTISKGAVHELLAFLNQFYLDNSCHGTRAVSGTSCEKVHMLSVGHSFGALIDFQAFVGRLESGLNVNRCERAYGFGDMTILLNPAFEATRYRALFNNAINRPAIWGPYMGDDDSGNKCESGANAANAGPQVPTVVTLQSLGDWATGKTFPIFRWVSTRFAQTLSAEESYEQIHALGWVPAFRTHTLTVASDGTSRDSCANASNSSGTDLPRSFCPFSDELIANAYPPPSSKYEFMVLTFDPKDIKPAPPNYFPVWSVAVDKNIMVDHDDFWNPEIVRLIGILFADAYEQRQQLHAQPAP